MRGMDGNQERRIPCNMGESKVDTGVQDEDKVVRIDGEMSDPERKE